MTYGELTAGLPTPNTGDGDATPYGDHGRFYAEELDLPTVPIVRHGKGRTAVTVPCNEAGHDPETCTKENRRHGGHLAARSRVYEGVDPRCNIGVATGLKSRVVVLAEDTDQATAAFLALEGIDTEFLGKAPCAISPTGNRHYWLALPEGWDAPVPSGTIARWTAEGDLIELDVKGDGSVAVAPPSVVSQEATRAGRRPGEPAAGADSFYAYSWAPARAPDVDTPMAQIPASALEAIGRAVSADRRGPRSRGGYQGGSVRTPEPGECAEFDRVLDALAAAGTPAVRTGSGWRARCPSHRGQSNDALSIHLGEVKVLLWCFGRCNPEEVRLALGLRDDELVVNDYPSWRIARYEPAEAPRAQDDRTLDFDRIKAERVAWLRADRDARRELDAEDRAQTRQIEILSGDEILQAPDLEWRVQTRDGVGVLEATGIFELSGARQQFKTAILLDLMLGMVNGKTDWLGWTVRPTDGHVVLCIGEGGSGIKHRVEAWLTANPGTGLRRFHVLKFHDISLADRTDVAEVIAAIRGAVGGAAVAMVVFDAFADAFTGDENGSSRDGVGPAVAGLKRVASEFNAACGITHHSGHDGSRGRGSSRLEDAMDTVLHAQDRVLEVRKVKEAAKDEIARFEIEPVKVGRSFVVARGREGVAALSARHGRSEQEQKDKICRFVRANVSTSKSKIREEIGGRAETVGDLLEQLVTEGRLIVRGHGRGARYEAVSE